MKKIIAFITLTLLCAIFAVTSFAAQPGDYGYYDADLDGKVELDDVLMQIDTLLNSKDRDYTLTRVIRVLKASVSSEAVDVTIEEINMDRLKVCFSFEGYEDLFELPIYALGLDEDIEPADYFGKQIVISVPSPAKSFFDRYDASGVLAAAISKEAVKTYTVNTTVGNYYVDEERGENYYFIDAFGAYFPASEMGITSDTAKIAIVGLPVTVEIDCEEEFFIEKYNMGEAHIVSTKLPSYTVVDNFGAKRIVCEWVPDKESGTEKRVLTLGGRSFSLFDYSLIAYECYDYGWSQVNPEYIVDCFELYQGKYQDSRMANCTILYRTYTDEEGKDVLELLYNVIDFAKYTERELYDSENGVETTYTILGEYEDWEEQNLDGEYSQFHERFLDGTDVDSYSVPEGMGRASATVTVDGEAAENGDLIYYSYNKIDNILTVKENVGRIQTGVLSEVNISDRVLTVDGTDYAFSDSAPSEFSANSLLPSLDKDASAYDNLQYALYNGEIIYANNYTDEAEKTSYGYAVISFDKEVLSETLGIDAETYFDKAYDDFYIENGKVAAAFLNTATGEWEKGYIGEVYIDYMSDDEGYGYVCDLAESAVYSAVGMLRDTYVYERAKEIVRGGVAAVVSFENGVYTLAHRQNYDTLGSPLLPFGNADELIFDEYGRTGLINDKPYGKSYSVSTNEDTLIVMANSSGTVGIRRGTASEELSIPAWVEIYEANEDTIVFVSDYTDPWLWSGMVIANGSESYYITTADTAVWAEAENGVYTVTVKNLFNFNTLETVDFTYSSGDYSKAYELFDKCACAAPATLLYGSEEMGLEHYDDIFEVLLSTVYEDAMNAYIELDEDGSMFAELEAVTYDHVGEYIREKVETVKVVTVDTSSFDSGKYDFTPLRGAAKISVDTITAATAGVFDKYIADNNLGEIALAPLEEGAEEASVSLELYSVIIYNEETESYEGVIVKLIKGGACNSEVPEFPYDEDGVKIPDTPYAVVTARAEVVAPLLGIDEALYEKRLVSGYYLENGMVVAAFLNTATGEWEKGYIEAIIPDFDIYSGFFGYVDLAKIATYREIVTLSPQYEWQYENAKNILNEGIVAVVSKTNSVYTVSGIHHGYSIFDSTGDNAAVEWRLLIDRYDCEEYGLTFSDGKTSAIKATSDNTVEAASITLDEDTLIVAVGKNGYVGVRKGILTEEDNVYGQITCFDASSDLILFATDADIPAWCGDVSDMADTCFTWLADSSYEVEVSDTDSYVVTIYDIFNHKKKENCSISLEFTDFSEAKMLMQQLSDIMPADILYCDEEKTLSAVGMTHADVLASMYPEYVTVSPSDISFENFSATVVTVNTTSYSEEEYDFSALYGVGNSGNFDFPLSLDTLAYVDEETEGVLDNLTVNCVTDTFYAPSFTEGEDDAVITLNVYAVAMNIDDGTTEYYVIKLICGGEYEAPDVTLPEPEMPAAPEYGFAVMATDAKTVASLLGMDIAEFDRKSCDGWYIEDGMVVAAVLDRETGKLGKGYVKEVAMDYDPYSAAFGTYVDIASLAKYASLAELSAEKLELYTRACDTLRCGLVIAVSESENVYTVANIHTSKGTKGDTATEADFFIDRWYSAEGITFDGGKTSAIKASGSGTAAELTLKDDSVIAICYYGGVEVYRGIPDDGMGLPQVGMTFVSATEKLIVAYSDMNVVDWGYKPYEAIYYYGDDSTIELCATDVRGRYTLTFSSVLNLKTLDTETVSYTADREAVYGIFYSAEDVGCNVIRVTDDWIMLEHLEPDMAMQAAHPEYGFFTYEGSLPEGTAATVITVGADAISGGENVYIDYPYYEDEDYGTGYVEVDGEKYCKYSVPSDGISEISEATLYSGFSDFDFCCNNVTICEVDGEGNTVKLGAYELFSIIKTEGEDTHMYIFRQFRAE